MSLSHCSALVVISCKVNEKALKCRVEVGGNGDRPSLRMLH